ncbi:MAG: long-chain fatty acid--CoA ligase, partial [Chitinophagaceae bacterium]|nr:long-chain fatty acid--CoA ligase [Chitinophagaceae bacterium]
LTDGRHRYNFTQLYQAVLQLSFTISRKIEITKETSAILICDNTVNHILAFYAIQNLGIRLVLVNKKVHPAHLSKIISQQKPHCYLFTTDTGQLSMDGSLDINDLITNPGTKGEAFAVHLAKLIFPTSGTTGEPKLVEKRAGEFYWIRSFADLLVKTKINKRRAVYISIPVSHGFGYTAVLFALILGKKAVVTDEKDQSRITELILKEEADLLAGVPASLNQLSENFKHVIHPIRTVISGGAPLNETIFKNVTQVFGKEIFSIYGSTEASVSFIAGYTQLSQHVNALGRPLKGVKYRLASLPAGGYELLLQSGLSNISTGNGWLHTGDLAAEDSKGNLVWCGRKDNMIIKNGVNIYPEEIEAALLRLPSIEDAYVKGEKDTRKGEIIIAIVKMKPGCYFTESEIKESLKATLPGIKIPDKITKTDHFQYTSTGKKMTTRSVDENSN